MSERGTYNNEIVIGRGGGGHGGVHGGRGGRGRGGRGRSWGGWGWGGWGGPYYGWGWDDSYVPVLPDYHVDGRRMHYLMGAEAPEGGARDHRSLSTTRDHRAPISPARPVEPPVVHPAPPIVHPVVPVAPPIVHPVVPVHPVAPPVQVAPPAYTHPRDPWAPPAAHHRHHDYAFVENYGWWPQWYPYWEPYWYWYWQYLYNYYGGDAYAEYAEYARDAVLRELAPQWGWQ